MQSNPQERKRKQKEKNILTGKKKKNILDTHRPSHGRTYLEFSALMPQSLRAAAMRVACSSFQYWTILAQSLSAASNCQRSRTFSLWICCAMKILLSMVLRASASASVQLFSSGLTSTMPG